MPISFVEYSNADMSVDEDTHGGDTYYMGSVPVCFAFVSEHARAVGALTNGASKFMEDIKQSTVDRLLERGVIKIDDSNCTEETGWLGLKVFDEFGTFLGEVGARCSIRAGTGTLHKDTGRCKWHDKIKADIGIKAGKRAKISMKSIQKKVDTFLTDADATNLMRELATQRAMMQMLVEWVADEVTEVNFPDLIEKVIKLNDVIGRQAERISAIEQRHALTAGQVLYLQTVVIEILKTYIEDPRMLERATYDLASRLGFSVAQNKSGLLAVNTDW